MKAAVFYEPKVPLTIEDLEIDEPVNPDKVIEFDCTHSINRTAMELIDEISRKTNST